MFSQDELDDTVRVWDAHTIRPSRNPNVPSGQPNVMYSLPELYIVKGLPCTSKKMTSLSCARMSASFDVPYHVMKMFMNCVILLWLKVILIFQQTLIKL